MRRVVLTVGNDLMGDDAAGPELARRLQAAPAPGWNVIDGGSAPENCLGQVRALQPDLVLVVDAAEMGLGTGEIRCLSADVIARQWIMTTHHLPLTFLIEALKEFVPEVVCVGIQPAVVAFGQPLSPSVEQAIDSLCRELRSGAVALDNAR